MRALIAAELRSRWRSLAALAAGTFTLLLALAGTYSAYGGSQGFGQAFGTGHAPALFSAFAGTSGTNIFAPASFLAFGFTHPLFLVLALASAVTVGVGAVAGDVESGRAELLYTAPVPRSLIYDARTVACLIMELAVVAAAVIGAEIGRLISSDLSAVSALVPLRVAAQLLPLLLFFAALTFAISAASHTRGQAQGLTIAAAAGAYLVNLVSLLWSPVEFTAHVNPFHYFQATQAATSISVTDVVVLLAAALVFFVAGRWRLERRDLA
jgi:ABC-type transport system involved in multi-copper enzyme maturation permease subunit